MLHWSENTFAGAFTGFAATMPEAGIAAGTKVATTMGWRAVEALAEGDMVLTFDHGLQPVTEVRRVTVESPAAADPIIIPAGALGNAEAMLVAPGQGVLIESDLAEDLAGDPFVLIEARALSGYRGIGPAHPAQGITLITLGFADDEIIYSRAGVLVQCAAEGDLLANLFGTATNDSPMLTGAVARAFAAMMIAEDY
jgi:hypothetical protein